ncbi:MAG: hypothetical protein VX589_02790 [Myxococcota bacterium]|nr:hypothetical protein [Myxococcota bacterium]
MIAGLNSELRRKGRTLHIQTEVRRQPLTIVTEVFVRGHVVLTYRSAMVEDTAPSVLRNAMAHAHRRVQEAIGRGDVDAQVFAPARPTPSDIPLARKVPLESGPEEA